MTDENKKVEGQEAEEQGTALTEQLNRRIPVYDAIAAGAEDDPEKQAQKEILDAIIEGVDLDDPNAHSMFGNDVLEEGKAAVEKIINEMMDDKTGPYRTAISDYQKTYNTLGIGGLQEDISDALDSAGNSAGKAFRKVARNWKSLGAGTAAAAGAAAFVPVIGLPLAGAAMLGGVGKTIYDEHKRSKSEVGEVEQIQDKIKETVTQIGSMRRKLEVSKGEIPKQRTHLKSLRTTNEEALLGLAVTICAGRELQKRIKLEIDGLRETGEDPDLLESRQRFAIQLNRRLAVIETTFAVSTGSMAHIATMQKSMDDIEITIDSILGPETMATQIQIATGALAINNYELVDTVDKFRKTMKENRENTQRIVEISEKKARETRPDSPELLKEYQDWLQKLATHQATVNQKELDFEKESQAARDNLLAKANELMDTMKKSESERAERLADAVLKNTDTGTAQAKPGSRKKVTTSDTTKAAVAAFGGKKPTKKNQLKLGGPG